jgi:hypothetical protein
VQKFPASTNRATVLFSERKYIAYLACLARDSSETIETTTKCFWITKPRQGPNHSTYEKGVIQQSCARYGERTSCSVLEYITCYLGGTLA